MSVVRQWESMGAFLTELGGREYTLGLCRDNDPWAGGISHTEALRRAAEGDPDLVAAATAALDKVNAADVRESPRMGWDRGVVGHRVNVPAYLAGAADCMMRRVKRPRGTRHVRIYVSVGASATYSADELATRGATVLGLVEGLQRQGVACEVYACCFFTGERCCPNADRTSYSYLGVRLDTPLDLSVQGFALAHTAFLRRVMFAASQHIAGATSLAYCYPTTDVAHVRATLGLDPSDVVIMGQLYAPGSGSSAAKWIEEQISQIVRD